MKLNLNVICDEGELGRIEFIATMAGIYSLLMYLAYLSNLLIDVDAWRTFLYSLLVLTVVGGPTIVKRLRNLGYFEYCWFLMFVPCVNVFFLIILFFKEEPHPKS